MAGRSVSQVAPARGVHKLRPAAVEPAVVVFAVAVVAGPGAEILVETVMAEAHLVTEERTTGHRAPRGLRAALPIIHIVLLEGAARPEHPRSGKAQGLFHFRRRRLVDKDPGPDFGLIGAARVPHPDRARCRA